MPTPKEIQDAIQTLIAPPQRDNQNTAIKCDEGRDGCQNFFSCPKNHRSDKAAAIMVAQLVRKDRFLLTHSFELLDQDMRRKQISRLKKKYLPDKDAVRLAHEWNQHSRVTDKNSPHHAKTHIQAFRAEIQNWRDCQVADPPVKLPLPTATKTSKGAFSAMREYMEGVKDHKHWHHGSYQSLCKLQQFCHFAHHHETSLIMNPEVCSSTMHPSTVFHPSWSVLASTLCSPTSR
mmetsp:Transcript_6420/g.24104  ORF Transcript_6420/g.24104 Transcript_6420/m.24104 type:complete len:233 (-) Transcript_6420:601-1299(-)